jgi:hypothetical protein
MFTETKRLPCVSNAISLDVGPKRMSSIRFGEAREAGNPGRSCVAEPFARTLIRPPVDDATRS